MSDRLRESLHDAAGAGSPPAALDALHARLVRRHRSRRRVRTAGALALSVLAVAGVAGMASQIRMGPDPSRVADPSPPSTAEAPAGWSALPPSPLGARHGARAVAVGSEVLVLGGRTDLICPPTAACVGPSPEQTRRDGAAYDLDTGSWRSIADAPVLPSTAALAVVGDVVHLLTSDRFVGYDVSDDRWIDLPLPPGEDGHRPTSLVAAGDLLVGYQFQTDRPDVVFDGQAWAPLPGDPLAPSFDRQYVWTGRELVLLAADLVANPGSDGPSLQQAAVLDPSARTWRELPAASDTVTGSLDWSWDGRRVVSPASAFVDGGEVGGYGRAYSTGGALDPATGQWSLLPPPPAAEPGRVPRSGIQVSSERYKSSAADALLDTTTDTWMPVPAPPAEVGAYATQAWAGEVLLVWGGGTPFEINGDDGTLLATGALLRP